MEEEKQAFEKWLSVKKYTIDEIRFDEMMQEGDAVGFYAGYHSRDAEIAELQAQVIRMEAIDG